MESIREGEVVSVRLEISENGEHVLIKVIDNLFSFSVEDSDDIPGFAAYNWEKVPDEITEEMSDEQKTHVENGGRFYCQVEAEALVGLCQEDVEAEFAPRSIDEKSWYNRGGGGGE